MQHERLLTVRALRAVPFSKTPVSRREEPPPTRSLRPLDALVDAYFESKRASKRPGARQVLELMLHACHAENRPFEGWWPTRACIEVYTYGPLGLGWGDSTALKCVGGFFRFAFERDALSASELLWLLCGLEQARRARGYSPNVIKVPDTAEFQRAKLLWATYQSASVAARAGRATGLSVEMTKEMLEPVHLAGTMLAAQDGVPVRFAELEPEAYRERALQHARSKGHKDASRRVRSRILPTMADSLERMAHAHAIHPERALELAAELRRLAKTMASRT